MLDLDKIIIGGIEMPRTRTLEVGGEPVAKEATMASGLMVQDVVGYRKKLSAKWEWIPVETLAQLTALVRTGEYIEIQYPDPVDGTASGMFKVTIGDAKIFRFTDGEPRWYNVDLTAKAQEVT